MSNAFFQRPIFNSPYYYPRSHWELDMDGQPTEKITPERRMCSCGTPFPKPKTRKGRMNENQPDMFEEKFQGIEVEGQVFD